MNSLPSQNTLTRVTTLFQRGFPPSLLFLNFALFKTDNVHPTLESSDWTWHTNLRFSLPKRFFYAITDSAELEECQNGHAVGEFPQWNNEHIDPVVDLVLEHSSGLKCFILFEDASPLPLFTPYGRMNRLLLSLIQQPTESDLKPIVRPLKPSFIIVVSSEPHSRENRLPSTILRLWYNCNDKNYHQRFERMRNNVVHFSTEALNEMLGKCERLVEMLKLESDSTEKNQSQKKMRSNYVKNS